MFPLTSGERQKSILGTSIIFKDLFGFTRLFLRINFLTALRLLFLFFCGFLFLSVLPAAAQPDSTIRIADSAATAKIPDLYKKLLDSNTYLNSKGIPASLAVTKKKQDQEPVFFYIIVAMLIVLAVMKTVYSRYFSTLFRVFFNTSLRQNQLTDQLEQAKLPSLIFNIFFVITAGIYVYVLLHYFVLDEEKPDLYLVALCAAAVGACYFVKYLALQFSGWVTGYKAEANIYTFIIFLLNKVIGILLLPVVILVLFSSHRIADFAVFSSLIMLGLILLLRFFRSYSLLQNRLKVSRFHFLLYILGFEIMPLALIFKASMLFLGKNS